MCGLKYIDKSDVCMVDVWGERSEIERNRLKEELRNWNEDKGRQFSNERSGTQPASIHT